MQTPEPNSAARLEALYKTDPMLAAPSASRRCRLQRRVRDLRRRSSGGLPTGYRPPIKRAPVKNEISVPR